MDVDVKNALSKVTSNSKVSLFSKEILAEDIYSFIKAISTEKAYERFNYFSKMYLDGSFCADDFCNKDDLSHMWNSKNCPRELAFFYNTLGRCFLSNSIDKRDIDFNRFLEIIKELSDNDKCTSNTTEREKKEQLADATTKYNANGNIEEDEIKAQECEETETLEELLEQLNSLVGLKGVKEEVNQIINIIKVQKKAEEFGEKLPPLSLHLVFYGNPGTGKTTIARLIAKIYRCLGVLSKGHLVEVDRGKLVAGHVGQTATKTQQQIDKAMGGILFIDEAYTLTHNKGETDFGQESVDTILKAMEDCRDDFIVIVAGYPDLMKEFISSNPGLKSRFNAYIQFEDYSANELMDIFKLQCKSQNFVFSDGCEEYLEELFKNMYDNRDKDYANGREVRNYFENLIKARANRLSDKIETVSHEEYLMIKICDLKNAASMKKSI